MTATTEVQSGLEVAEALEQAALAELRARRPDRVLATNVESRSAVVLDAQSDRSAFLPGIRRNR